MLIKCTGMGAKISIKCHYEGCTKELKSLLGFQNHIFIMKKIKKSGSVRYANKNSLLSHNC